METKNSKSQKSLEDYAFDAWKALHSYQHALWKEFFRTCDPLDPNFLEMRKTYYDTHFYISDLMHKIGEMPNPFDELCATRQ